VFERENALPWICPPHLQGTDSTRKEHLGPSLGEAPGEAWLSLFIKTRTTNSRSLESHLLMGFGLGFFFPPALCTSGAFVAPETNTARCQHGDVRGTPGRGWKYLRSEIFHKSPVQGGAQPPARMPLLIPCDATPARTVNDCSVHPRFLDCILPLPLPSTSAVCTGLFYSACLELFC